MSWHLEHIIFDETIPTVYIHFIFNNSCIKLLFIFKTIALENNA